MVIIRVRIHAIKGCDIGMHDGFNVFAGVTLADKAYSLYTLIINADRCNNKIDQIAIE